MYKEGSLVRICTNHQKIYQKNESHRTLKGAVCVRLSFLGCSELKTPKYYHRLKSVVFNSDIKNYCPYKTMEKNAKIYVAGHRGLAGSALVRALRKDGCLYIITRASSELDLRDQRATEDFFLAEKPEYVFDAAAKVGGLYANNTYRAEFIYDNLQIQTNLIHASWKSGVKKLLFLGSNCIYPKECPQPMKEEHLWTGPLEPTNQPFAVAKLAGIEMCQAYRSQHGAHFISVIPASLYGPHDNYDPVHAHIVPTLIRKCHEAKILGEKEVNMGGSEHRRREMIYVDDMADACLFLMEHYDSPEVINVGTGTDHSVRELSDLVKGVVGFDGDVVFDTSKPTGMLLKRLDSSKIHALGWHPKNEIRGGLREAYHWFLQNIALTSP